MRNSEAAAAAKKSNRTSSVRDENSFFQRHTELTRR
jgi:hypothetical protein